MRDIGSRIQRYRLSRYAAPVDVVRRRLRWGWLLGALWLLWVGLISDHSLLRIWSLGRENGRVKAQLASARDEIDRLDTQLKDPAASRRLAEHELREKSGMARPNEIVYRIRGGGTQGDTLERAR
jgi:cell division protein FtsB